MLHNPGATAQRQSSRQVEGDEPPTAGALIARARDGDQAAWNALVDRYTNLLWGVARAHRLSTADGAEVVQTTWLRLVENLGRIQDPERLPGWLATTARRESLRVIRQGNRERLGGIDTLAVDVVDDRTPALDALLLTQERDVALWACFDRLSERCQRLLRVLMVTEPPAYVEVSEALGMPVGSIGPTRMRCLDRLRQFTREAGYAFESSVDGSVQ